MIKFYLLVAISVSVCSTAWAAPGTSGKVIMGYSASWRDEIRSPTSYDFDGLTHICRAFLIPSPSGSIAIPAGYFNPQLEALAHRHGIKLLMSLGGGENANKGWLSIAHNPPCLRRFLDNLARLMADNHYDGVDIDWEPSPESLADGAAYTSLLKAVRVRFPHAVLTTALTTDEYAVKFFSWPEVIAAVDYVNVMTYDYAGSWGGVAGHATNLYPAGDYKGLPEHSVEEGMQNLLQNHHVPPAKMLMGMNFWAYRFRADKIGDPFTKNGDHVSDDLSYQQVLDLIGSGQYQAKWDAHAASPYLLRNGGGGVVVYDNPKSIRLKCEYARHLGCAGVMIWNIGADESGPNVPLMDAMVEAYGGKPIALDRAALENQVAEVDQMLVNGGRPSSAAARASLSTSQLLDLYTRLHKSAGVMNDQQWQSKGGATGN